MAWVMRTGTDTLNIISGDNTGNSHAFWRTVGRARGLGAGHGGQWCDVQDTVNLELNVWYHAAVTYDAVTDTLTLYKNGVLIDTGIASRVIPMTPPFTSVVTATVMNGMATWTISCVQLRFVQRADRSHLPATAATW